MTVFATSTSNPFFPRVRGTLEERFWAKIMTEPNTGCWLWCGDFNGVYGNFSVRSPGQKQRRYLAHRFSYELNVGPIPDGLTIDHKCRTPLCVNPLHLRAVTQAENLSARPTDLVIDWRAKKTTCKYGHSLVPGGENWKKKQRYCPTCQARWDRERRARARTL